MYGSSDGTHKLVWYDPETNAFHRSHQNDLRRLRAWTESPDFNGAYWWFDIAGKMYQYWPLEDRLESRGPNWSSNGYYSTSIEISPDGRYLYYSFADNNSIEEGLPIIQYDILKDQRKVLAFLSNGYYTTNYNYTPIKIYGYALSPDGTRLFISCNGRLPRDRRQSMFYMHIPEQERQPLKSVSNFVLLDNELQDTGLSLHHGSIIDASDFPSGGTYIKAPVTFDAKSVVFELNGHQTMVNETPFLLGGSDWHLPAGEYELKATPYDGPDGEGEAFGSLSIRFTVIPFVLMNWVEAESAAEQENFWPLVTHAFENRSGSYISAMPGSQSLEAAPEAGHARYHVNSNLEVGTIALWMRIRFVNVPDFSYWTAFNDEEFEEFTATPAYFKWEWVKWGEREVTGTDTLTLAYRNDVSQVDRLFVTNDLTYVPSGDGDGIPTSGDHGDELRADVRPDEISLHSNYPNPFNPSTNIRYDLPFSGYVKLNIYDITGRLVTTLVDEVQHSGSYRVSWDAAGMASGLYFYRLRTDHQIMTRQMTLVK